MGKKYLKKAVLLLLLAAITVAAVVPVRLPKSRAKDWMAELDDNQEICTLSIPGTHDSGALYSIAGLFGKCQTLSIPQQLKVGVRFLDLRLRLVDEELQVYHNFVEQKTRFTEVLDELVSFLRENPSEFLIVSIKKEGGSIRSESDFAATLEALLLQYPDVVCTDGSIPETVGSARGKLYLVARYENSTIGIPSDAGWTDNASFEMNGLYVQDHYKLGSVQEKTPDIQNAFAAAASGKYSLVLNFTSCYFPGSFPPSYAGVPALTINPWLQSYLKGKDPAAGVFVSDFMTAKLAKEIIKENFR